MDINKGKSAGPGRARGRGGQVSDNRGGGRGRGRGSRDSQETVRAAGRGGGGPSTSSAATQRAWGPRRDVDSGSGGGGGVGAAAAAAINLPPVPQWGPPKKTFGAAAAGGGGGGGGDTQQASTSRGQQGEAAAAAAPRAASKSAVETGAAASTVRDDARGAVRGKRVLHDIIKTRPDSCVTKIGTSGTKVKLETNYFRVVRTPRWNIYQYRVDFAPDVDLIKRRHGLLNQNHNILGGFLFDGTVLFSSKLYCAPGQKEGNIDFATRFEDEDTNYQIKIRHVGTVDCTQAQHLQVLNLIVRKSMAGLKLQLVGRNYFDPKEAITLDNYKLQIWPGYQTSIRQHERDILMCSEIAHKVMRKESILDIYKELRSRYVNDYQDAFKQEVIGTIALTSYNNKTYRITDVDFNSTPNSTFMKKGEETSYAQYYLARYGKNCTDLSQPMLVSSPTERNIRGGNTDFIMLIPEFACATGITDHMRNNFRLMRAMSDHTRLIPERRIQRLTALRDRLRCPTTTSLLNSWALQLEDKLVTVDGRVLPNQRILFGGNRSYTCDERADWSREFRDTELYTKKDITRWCVIVPRRFAREAQNFIGYCYTAAKGMRLVLREPQVEITQDDRNSDYLNAIDNAAARDPQLLMIVLPNKNEDKYGMVKKKCCVDRPVLSQVVTIPTIAPRNDKANPLSVATKVVIQMSAKIMGMPWMIDLPLNGLMTIGFDVCHSPKDRNKSYGALVATMDMKQSPSYFSAVNQHIKGQELSNEVALHVSCALKSYCNQHGCLPARIVFYRDGVGDGQLHQVITTEVKVVKQRLLEIYNSNKATEKPRFTFIIVSKRINTRYFANKQNPKPGTVVDDVITLPERYDFFLVSQSVRQGTVSPTSYNVISDNLGLDCDRLQQLTYKMTHLYYNWAGTCRVPAVCQYAHKLAYLVAENIGRAPSNALEKKLYFL